MTSSAFLALKRLSSRPTLHPRFLLNLRRAAIEAMIKTEAQLQQAIEQIENLCRAVEALRKDIFPQNPRNFAILAEGPVDEIPKLQALIDDYLRRGDVATVVEHHPGGPGQEPGYSLEVFNAVGEALPVVTVREFQNAPLTPNEVLHVRPLAEVVT